MSHKVEIQEGAVIVSDAHYSHRRPELFLLLKDIYTQKVQTTQVILMGDIFDTLFGGVLYTYRVNSEMIELINAISNRMEIIYLEGNHDFNLQTIFPKVKIFPITQQPLLCSYYNKKIYLAHGDFDVGNMYKFYTSLIRDPFVLFILKSIDILTKHLILKKLDVYLGKKDDCKEFIDFECFVQERLHSKFKCDYFIEGHYHQNRLFFIDNYDYINLAAFACNQRYFIVKSLQSNKLLEEKRVSQGDVKNG